MTTAQQRMGAENYEKMRQWIKNKESGGNYASLQSTPLFEKGKKVADNVDSGYRGAYQMGASYAKEAGLIKSDSGPTGFETFGKTQLERAAGHKAFMENNSNWKDPPGSLQNFLTGDKAKEIQDQAFDRVTQKNYQALVANKVIKPEMPPDEVAGHLMGAHAAGVKGYTDFVNVDPNRTDGAGTRVSTYYNGAAAAVSGKAPPPPGNKTEQKGKPADDKTAKNPGATTGSNRSLEATRIGNEVTIGTVAKKKPPIPLPFTNVLSAFSSYNAVITLSCITSAMHSDPKASYKNGNLGVIVLRSSGAGDLAGQTAITTKENPTGKYDFGINNLEISSLITFNQATQASNGHDITFDVYEPYSMGLFMQACQNAADAQGWPTSTGYMTAVFLLTIEFIGYDSDGKSTTIPNTTRNIPFTFRDIAMTTTAGGSVYKVQAQPSNFAAFLNNFNLFEHDIAVEGSTVQEALQSGERSLQTIVNKRLQEYASKYTTAPTAFDEVVIIFPKINELQTVDQRGNALGIPIDPTDGTITTRFANNAINTETGESYFRGALALPNTGVAKADPNAPPVTSTVSRKTSAANLIQESDDLNQIGKSILQFDNSLTGESGSNDQDDIQVDPANPISRNKVTYDKNKRQFQYSQGTSIVNAISSILLHSKYCRAGLDAQKADPKGMIPWFRIESEVHYQPPKDGNLGDNNLPKLLVFKVVPYLVHSEKNTANGAEPAGLAELATEVAKEYDYLYTGKNTEVLGFNIEFKQAMFNAMAKGADNNKNLTDNGRLGATPDSDTSRIASDNSSGSSSYHGERGHGRPQNNPPTPPSNTNGGLNFADQRTIVAQAFQRALNDAATDLVMIPNFTIMGDPYFLADSGLGNFSSTGTGSFNVTKDLTMDYQSGEVDIAIVFRTPIDYNSSTGLMDFGDTSIVRHFSGLYKVNEVKHRFNSGKFTQELSLMRRRNQTAEALNKPAPVSTTNNPAPVTLVRSTDTNDAVAFSGAAQATAIDSRPAIEARDLPANTPNQRVAAFNRSDLANDDGGSGSATANPTSPTSFGKSFVERLGIIKNRIVSTLTKPKDSNENQDINE